MYKKVLVLFLVAFSICLGFNQSQAHATDGGQALSISPPIIQLKADPGKSAQGTIKITNMSSDPAKLATQINDFTAKDESGVPSIIFEDKNDDNRYTLKNWITTEKSFDLKSKESKTLQFTINVPANAEPGGHYAVVRFSVQGETPTQTGVGINTSIGSLILLRVNGQITDTSKLADFYSATPRYVKSGFFENGPIGFITRINNTGNIHNQPTGTIKVYNMFGKQVGTLRVNGDPSDAKNPPRNVLPKSIRRFEQTLNTNWMLGRYKADLNLSYGDGKVIQSTITFWVIPYKMIILTIVGIVALITALVIGIKKYNKFIVKKSQHKSSNN